MTAVTSFRVPNLLLLVGTNPLPNYVAARLLAVEQGDVYLLHTEMAQGRLHRR